MRYVSLWICNESTVPVLLLVNKSFQISECLLHFEQTTDSGTVLTYQVSSVQLVTDKKLEALSKA